jgi:hypothetical protein
MAANHDYNFSRKDIGKLLVHFGCQPNDLLTLIREEKKIFLMPDIYGDV